MAASANTPIRIGIVGYGNLGHGVELALAHNADMRLAGIYTRRDPATVQPQGASAAVHRVGDLPAHAGAIDVLILCGGSKDDLPLQSPALARHFNLVDSFDTHPRIPEHFAAVDRAAKAGQTSALISTGWDPGLFSIQRVMAEALLPDGDTYTFWGKGVSQGHSDALRHVPGVAGGVQYTVPVEAAIEQVRSGTRPRLSTRQKHTRECYVVLKPGADADAVRQAIVAMPAYFAEYDTTVHFISAEELKRDHAAMPHGGFVIRSGHSSKAAKHVMEFSLKLDSNPEFTAGILVAYARAVWRLHQAGQFGAKTVLDVPPALLSPHDGAELRRRLL
ncbi:MAG: diaminopimelate dehydrogenase [Burkholderiaceae bacterium]|nr:MAG: diaminopimelate dehydrogenase [Burkholderiaceae bacterium]